MHNMIIRHYKETNPDHVADELDEDMYDAPPSLPFILTNRATTASNDLDDYFESNPSFSSKKLTK